MNGTPVDSSLSRTKDLISDFNAKDCDWNVAMKNNRELSVSMLVERHGLFKRQGGGHDNVNPYAIFYFKG